MADKSIEQLTAAEKVYLADLFVLQQSGTAKKLTGQVLKNWLLELAQGHGGITNIALQSTSGLNKTYRITLADDTYFDMTVADGKGITSVEKTGTSGLVDTYTMKFNAGSDFVFTVKNGEKGDKGDADRLYFKFASQKPTDSSHSMGDVPDEWLGFYAGTTAPSGWQDYTWVRIKGDKGDKGDAATLTGQSTTYMVSDSGTIVPSGSWVADVPNVPQGKYLWTRTVLTFNTGSPVTSYSVSRFGIDGTGSVSSVNSQNPDSTGNVKLTAADIAGSDGQSVEAALAGKQAKITSVGLLKGTGNGGVTDAVAGVDYQAPITAGAGIKLTGNKVSTAAAPRNLLDNSDFRNPVNQRGQSNYTKGSWGGYTIDRWAVGSSTENIVSLVDGGITLKGTLMQWLDAAYSKLFIGKKLTIAIKESGTIHVASGVVPDSTIWATVASTGLTDGFSTLAITKEKKLELSVSCTSQKKIEWVAVYEGEYTDETIPEYQAKGYSAELAECRRYYLNGVFAVTIGSQYGASKSIFSICIDAMRVIPTATITDVIAQGWGDVTKSDYIQDWAGRIGSKVYYNFINQNNAKDDGKTIVISATFSADV